MSYDWKILLDGFDISDKVSKVSVLYALSNFCGEMTIDFADATFYGSPDFSQIPEETDIEIFTKNGSSFISQGLFYIERPAITSTTQGDIMQGVWGRSITALLTEPFAIKVTKAWETQTTFFAICEEMCDLAGLDFDSAYSDIEDFVIYPYTYEADGIYPADVISELAGLAGAVATTDRAGHVCIKQVEYSPSVADETITDVDIAEISETPEWPVFANRVRITPLGSLGSYDVGLIIPKPCLPADGATKSKLFAQVKDADGNAVNGIVIEWSIDSATASILSAKTNTQEILILHEQQRSKSFFSVDVDFEPSYVDAIYAYSDTARAINLAAGGYVISGKTITLADQLAYCDQLLVVDYRAAGMAVNYLTPGTASEDVAVTVDLDGQRDSAVIYIDNPCQCPPSLSISAAPTSINKSSAAKLLVYAEDSGPITSGRIVFMSEKSASKKGLLSWTSARLGTVNVSNEKTRAKNEVAGLTQCETEMYPASVASVYAVDADGNQTGANLYASHDNKLVNLTTSLATGTNLLITYVAQGAAINTFTGNSLGDALLVAYMLSTREEGLEASSTIKVTDNTAPVSDYPDDWEQGTGDGGYGGTGGDDEEDFDPSDEGTPGAEFNWCVPDNVSSDPTPAALAGRFTTALEHDCDCELLCNEEFDVYGTTQGYDGASGEDVSALALAQCGEGCVEGSPAYYEKYEELKQEALADCLSVCQGAAFEWDPENPDTIGQSDQVAVSVIGGRGPFTWSVTGTGFSMEIPSTDERVNLLNADATSCGPAEITVTDALGASVSGVVKSTQGYWEVCCATGQTGCPNNVLAWTEYSGIYRIDKSVGNCMPNGCKSCVCDGVTYELCASDYSRSTTLGLAVYKWSC